MPVFIRGVLVTGEGLGRYVAVRRRFRVHRDSEDTSHRSRTTHTGVRGLRSSMHSGQASVGMNSSLTSVAP